MSDLIDRQAAIDAINGIINRFEQILQDIRESKVDDSVCGMCEYDGASYIEQSGDWCIECPGFNKDDCFKLSDECRKKWLESVDMPSAQPERKVFEEMSDAEFERWLHEHGICNPDIHESIPCDAIPYLIDSAINELLSAEPYREEG